jgi:hypothetical protein
MRSGGKDLECPVPGRVVGSDPLGTRNVTIGKVAVLFVDSLTHERVSAELDQKGRNL